MGFRSQGELCVPDGAPGQLLGGQDHLLFTTVFPAHSDQPVYLSVVWMGQFMLQ